MKKAFDANVSKAKPRVRLGAMMTETVVPTAEVEAIAQAVMSEPVQHDLSSALKTRMAARLSVKPTAAEAIANALETPVMAKMATTETVQVTRVAEVAKVEAPVQQVMTAVVAPVATASVPVARVEVAHVEAPAVTEVQTAPAPEVLTDADPAERRERLKERLRAVRENPRPEPLPETVAKAGNLAVERIAALQTELAKSRALNLALTQDLEATRRQAERATEEARSRTDEARRLSTEMEGRAKLLSELEGELAALEGERNDSLLSLQEARQALEQGEVVKADLKNEILKRDAEINSCLAEEERIAGELEVAQETMSSLRRANEALQNERDTLARQVSDLTRERTELLEARKALEAVHRALSQAVTR